jgi:hypothetical protein
MDRVKTYDGHDEDFYAVQIEAESVATRAN